MASMQIQAHRVETGLLNGAGYLMDERQAAAYLLTTPRTLRLWRQTRGVPHIRITSKVIRYRRADLDSWLARRLVALVA
jgi:hypothetical protein